MKTEWKRDEFAETKMSQLGIPYTNEVIALKSIDKTASNTNAAREERDIDPKAVEDYEAAFRCGDVFPKVILKREKGGRYSVIGGNHRLEAFRKSGLSDDVDAYVIDINGEAEGLLQRVLNRGNGIRQSREIALHGASWAMSKTKKSIGEIAMLFGLSTATISGMRRAEEAATKLLEGGVKGARLIPQTTLEDINQIKLDSVKIATGRIISEQGLKGADAKALINAVKSANRSEASQMAVISKYEVRQPFDIKPRRTAKQVNAKRFLQTLRTIKTITQGKSRLSAIGIEKDEIEFAKNECLEVSTKLAAFAGC